MNQPKRKPRLDEDQRKVLEYLNAAYLGGEGEMVRADRLQRETVWPIRPVVDSLKRRGLVDHDGERNLVDRYWMITDAGREAIS
jgi:hypothetical protein